MCVSRGVLTRVDTGSNRLGLAVRLYTQPCRNNDEDGSFFLFPFPGYRPSGFVFSPCSCRGKCPCPWDGPTGSLPLKSVATSQSRDQDSTGDEGTPSRKTSGTIDRNTGWRFGDSPSPKLTKRTLQVIGEAFKDLCLFTHPIVLTD